MAERKQMTEEEKEAQKRKILFTPCISKRQLYQWVKLFLELDMPDCIVDPDSTSTPLDMLWEVYSKALKNDDPNFNRVLYFASRDSYKTLGAAVLEVLAVVHLNRDVAHMAAQESQSAKSARYVKEFFSKPLLRDYLVGDNKQIMWIVRYNHTATGVNIPEAEFKLLSKEEQGQYTKISHYIRIVICTKGGANSEHVPFFVVDEVDVVTDPSAYDEAKSIPAPRDGMMPITILTSTRKYSFGLVQKEIDAQFDEDGNETLQVRHWNIIDVTEACPPERHLPEEPKIPIYVNADALRAISEERFEGLNDEDKERYTKEEGYAGCLKNCKLFSACMGRLATEQKSTSPLLKPIWHTQNQFFKSNASIQYVNAQYLCRKPSREGLIYPNFERSIHMLTATQMAEKISGVPEKPNMTKAELIAFMKARGMGFGTGVDYGFTHNFVAVTGGIDGHRAFVIDVISQAELEPSQQVAALDGSIKHLDPTMYADPENPQMTAVLRRAGYRMATWKKGPGSVVGGINTTRMMLMPPLGAEPRLFLLLGDPGCELLAKRISGYHWKIDSAERISDVPDEKDDDECDGLRYFTMNAFKVGGGKVQAANTTDSKSEPYEDQPGVYTRENWAKKILEEATQGGDPGNGGLEGKKGSVKWSF